MLRLGSALLVLCLAACGGSSSSPPVTGSGGASGSGGSTPAGSGGVIAAGSGGAAMDTAGPTDTAVVPDTGSGGTVGTPDATPADTTADTGQGAMPGCPAGALLCEDFESYTGASVAPNWMTDNVGGTLQVDTSKPFKGTKAVHFTAGLNTSSQLQIWKQGAPLFPVKNNSFYGRVMLWLSRQPTGGVHFNTVQANGMLPGSTQIAKYAYGAMYARLMAGYTIRNVETGPVTVDCGKSPTGINGYPTGKWVCAEWKFDGTNDEMRYWFDGVEQTAVAVMKTNSDCVLPPPGNRWQAPVFNKLMLGWYSQPFNMAVELWMDDIVVSTEKIGCPAP